MLFAYAKIKVFTAQLLSAFVFAKQINRIYDGVEAETRKSQAVYLFI